MKKYSIISITVFALVLSFAVYQYGNRFLSKDGRQVSSYLSKGFHRWMPGDWIFFSIGKDIKTKGPVHKLHEDSDYMKRIFGLLIQEADKISHDDWYLENTANRTYYGFLLGALTVPYHESTLIHFRKRDSKNCSTETNNLNRLKKRYNQGQLTSDSRMKRILARSAKNTHDFIIEHYKKDPKIFPDCLDYEPGDEVTQLLASGTFGDLGLMQLNSKAHPTPYLNGDIFDVKKTIRYGLKFLYSGYNKLANNFDNGQYNCLLENDQLNYKNLILGTWSGKYNSGRVSKTCRIQKSIQCFNSIMGSGKAKKYSWLRGDLDFWEGIYQETKDSGSYQGSITDRECEWIRNDMGLLKHFSHITKTFESPLNYYLPADSVENLAFKEILKNFKEGTDEHKNLDIVLATDYHNDAIESQPQEDEEIINTPPIITEQEETNKPEETSSIETTNAEPVEVLSKEEEQSADNTEEVVASEQAPAEVVVQEDETNEERLPIPPKDEQQIPSDNGETFPRIPVESFTYIVRIKNSNIRFAPDTSTTVCGNIKLSPVQPVKVQVRGFDNDFAIIEAKGLKNLIFKGAPKNCFSQETLFIHKKLVNRVDQYEIVGTAIAKVSANLRPGAGMSSGDPFSFIPKSERVGVIASKVFGNRYLWYKVIRPNGETGWVYGPLMEVD